MSRFLEVTNIIYANGCKVCAGETNEVCLRNIRVSAASSMLNTQAPFSQTVHWTVWEDNSTEVICRMWGKTLVFPHTTLMLLNQYAAR